LRRPPAYQVPRFFDAKDKRMASIIRLADEAKNRSVNILGVPYDGAVIGRKGAVEGPSAIRQVLGGAANYSPELGVDLLDARVFDLGDIVIESEDPEAVQNQVRIEAYDMLESSSLLVVLGGDNSISLGSITACAKKFGKIGLVALDAHYDLRGKIGGKPTNGSSYGLAINTLKSELDPKRVVEIGVRGFVNSRVYADEARELGIVTYTPADVRKLGAAKVAQQAYEAAATGADAVYLSVDVDCIDMAQVCGVSAPSSAGLDPWEVYEMVHYFGRQDKVTCSDLVELAPPLDPSGRSQAVATTVLLYLLAGFKTRGLG